MPLRISTCCVGDAIKKKPCGKGLQRRLGFQLVTASDVTKPTQNILDVVFNSSPSEIYVITRENLR